MDSGKRASMREGPLAALFRRTDEEGLEGERRPPERRQRPKEEPSAERKPATGKPFPAAKSGNVAEHAEELRPAPPSARVEHAPEPPAGRPARSPEQRLREVFAADIPENIMERTSASAPTRDEYRGRYGREEPQVSAMPAPVLQPVLRVVGVGGAGVNAVNRMIEAGVEGVDFIAINTDMQSLQQSSADMTLHIGSEVTRGLGSGSNPELGRQAAIEE
jgi:cell division protein FtsZ